MDDKRNLKVIINLASKTLNEPTDYEDTYIAFLDILGFKEIVKNKTAQEIKTIFNEMRKANLLYCESDLFSWIPREVRENTNIIFLSDSIIISISSKIKYAFSGLLTFCLYLQSMLIGRKNPVLIRGAICKADIFRLSIDDEKTSIIFGPGLNKANYLHENIAIYPRIIIENLLLEEEKNNLLGEELKMVEAFTQKGDDGFWFIDYLKLRFIEGEEKFQNIRTFIQDEIKNNTNERVLQKIRWLKIYYNNTLELFNKGLKENMFDEL